MTQFHSCKRSGCTVKPDGTKWPTDADGRVVYGAQAVFDNNTGKMMTVEEAKARKPKTEVGG